MNDAQKQQYLELQEMARKEHKAEMARIRRAARKWIQDRYGLSEEELDKAVSQYKLSQVMAQGERERPEEGPGGNPPATKGRSMAGTSNPGSRVGSIRRNTNIETIDSSIFD